MNSAALLAALDLSLALMSKAQEVSALVRQAHAENRDLTKEEIDKLTAADDEAIAGLKAAIANAQSEGR